MACRLSTASTKKTREKVGHVFTKKKGKVGISDVKK